MIYVFKCAEKDCKDSVEVHCPSFWKDEYDVPVCQEHETPMIRDYKGEGKLIRAGWPTNQRSWFDMETRTMKKYDRRQEVREEKRREAHVKKGSK